MKKALIFGITGQDGAYLTHFLLNKGYEVHGVERRHSHINTTTRLDILRTHYPVLVENLHMHYGDLTDFGSVLDVVKKVMPDEIYNLAAQSHVAVSFDVPVYTGMVDGIGCTHILEAIRVLDIKDSTKFYQASTSELYGDVLEIPQTEKTPFNPQSPYAVAKLYAYKMSTLYREAYNIFACNGILFNHESPLRGDNFVTRKITIGLSRIKHGMQKTLALGNLNAKRDWGHARDYVELMWSMLQTDVADDFVIAMGEQYSVRYFVEQAAKEIGIEITWQGEGVDEKGYDQDGNVIITVDPKFYRPAEVETLLGDPTKAKERLGWTPKTPFSELVKEMMHFDMAMVEGKQVNPFD